MRTKYTMDLIGLTLRQVENLTGEACWQKYGVDILGRVPNSMAKRIIQKADFSFLLRENKQYGIGSYDLRGFWVGQENVLSAARKSFSTAAACFV